MHEFKNIRKGLLFVIIATAISIVASIMVCSPNVSNDFINICLWVIVGAAALELIGYIICMFDKSINFFLAGACIIANIVLTIIIILFIRDGKNVEWLDVTRSIIQCSTITLVSFGCRACTRHKKRGSNVAGITSFFSLGLLAACVALNVYGATIMDKNSAAYIAIAISYVVVFAIVSVLYLVMLIVTRFKLRD